MDNSSITCPYKEGTPEHKDWWYGLIAYYLGIATGFEVHSPEWTEGYNAGEEIYGEEPFEVLDHRPLSGFLILNVK